MTPHDCAGFDAQLLALLDGQGAAPLNTADAADCARCQAVLTQTRDVLTQLTAAAAAPLADVPAPRVQAQAIAAGGRLARWAFRAGVLVNVLVSAGLMWFWLRYFVWAPYQRVGGSNVLAVSLMCTAIAAALLATLIVPGPSSKARLRARWRGRWLQGICVGLAEYLGVSVWLIRAALLTLLLTGNYGGTLYFMLAFVVPLHPDDRQHLTGFRLQRWWRARRAA